MSGFTESGVFLVSRNSCNAPKRLETKCKVFKRHDCQSFSESVPIAHLPGQSSTQTNKPRGDVALALIAFNHFLRAQNSKAPLSNQKVWDQTIQATWGD
eukprot:71760-Amphidinium_carterae.1